MIPTMILFGVLTGYWWRAALVLAAVAWPVVVVTQSDLGAAAVPAAALLGVANATVGVLVVQAGLGALRVLRRRPT